ncbi:S9 family peptidase [Mycoplasmatota bacterium]|nr:S9 family peptidase [Mycoplasmatota bacterium]
MKKIKIKDFLDFSFLGNLQESPSKKYYGFIQSEPLVEDNQYKNTLYISDGQEKKKIRQLNSNSEYLFLSDYIILLDYQKNKKEKDELKDNIKKTFYYYDIHLKKLQKAFTLPMNAKLEKVINEKEILLSVNLTVDDHILYEGNEEARASYLKQKKKNDLYEDIDEIPYYFNGSGFKTNQVKQLFIYDIKSKQVKRLLDKSFSVETFTLSQDKSKIYYSGKHRELVMSHTSKIYVYDLETHQNKVLFNEEKFNIGQILDMGKIVVLAKDMQDYGLNQNPDFYELKENNMVLLSEFGKTFGNTVGTDCRLLGSKNYLVQDNFLYFVSTVDDHNEILKLNTNGDITKVYEIDGAIDGLLMKDNHFIMIAMHQQKLQEIYRLEGDLLKQITSFNKKVFAGKYIASPQEIIVEKITHEVKGFALLPEGYNPNRKYPMILDIHGGPKTVYGKIYYHEMQYWVNQGYVVIFANPRGSDGKGNDFADIRGKYGTIDYEDLMDFVDRAIDLYQGIDQSQMYVTGGSYGGFMTNWIVGHTHRFKAAVTQRSISNWISFYGTSDIGYYFATDQTAGHPIVDLDQLYRQSPIKYAMNIQTPLLFIHSDKDYRCPMEQAQQLYAILKTRGVDTKLIWFKDETHELSRGGKPQARIKRIEDISNWFKKH